MYLVYYLSLYIDPATRAALHAPTSKNWTQSFNYPFENNRRNAQNRECRAPVSPVIFESLQQLERINSVIQVRAIHWFHSRGANEEYLFRCWVSNAPALLTFKVKLHSYRPMAFLSDLAANSSAHNISWIIYSGNDDLLVGHFGSESSSFRHLYTY